MRQPPLPAEFGHTVNDAAAAVDDDHGRQHDVHGHVVRVIQEGLGLHPAVIRRLGGGVRHLCRGS